MSESLDSALLQLPHGPEFRFVDRLTTLIPGIEGTGEYTLRSDEAFLRGHFPGYPLMPGVLLIEAVAQLAGVVAQSDPSVRPLNGLKLTAIRAAKISGSARPGETLVLGARVIARLGQLIQAEGQASVGGVQVVKCEITMSGLAGRERA